MLRGNQSFVVWDRTQDLVAAMPAQSQCSSIDLPFALQDCAFYKWSGYRIADAVNDCSRNGDINLCHGCEGGVVAKQEHTCDGEPDSVHEPFNLLPNLQALQRCYADPACAAVTTDEWQRTFFVSEYAMQSATKGGE
eukprot:5291544-Amphidinium_carterae.1